MLEKEKEKKHLSWLGIELPTSISGARKIFTLVILFH
jgi:hypothetical protein